METEGTERVIIAVLTLSSSAGVRHGRDGFLT